MKQEFENIKNAVKSNQHRFRLHALERMIERDIQPEEIKEAILNGEIIESYPEDKYGPSCLICGSYAQNKIIHVHCSIKSVWIITAYDPSLSPEKWDEGFKNRRHKT